MKWMVIPVALAAVVLAGCGSTSGYAAESRAQPSAGLYMDAEAESIALQTELGAIARHRDESGDWGGAVGTPEELAGRERLLIYTGQFTVAVGNVEDAQNAARGMAEGLGGYFQSITKDSITLRVPATRWEEAVSGVGEIGRVLDRAIEAADVTEEVIDLRLRLRNAQKMMSRLEELLAKAESVEAALKVETELGRVRTEVERLEGRLKYLGDRIAFSTLTIRFRQVQETAARPQALPFPWLSELSLEGLLGLPGGVR